MVQLMHGLFYITFYIIGEPKRMNIPDYIEDVLMGLSPFVKIELLRLLSQETTTSNVIQKRYRTKSNRQKFVNLGLVLQLYKDINILETN